MRSSDLTILYEDNHLLAVDKPAGLATQGAMAGEVSLWSLAKDYLKQQYNKPGNVYLGVVSRLDAAVTGVTLFARTSKAAARLSEQFRERTVDKRYWALIPPGHLPSQGQLEHWLVKDEGQQRMITVAANHPGAQHAQLEYRLMGRADQGSPGREVQWLEVRLITGRKHQIRVQLSANGFPIAGDRKYDSPLGFRLGIGLHAQRLSLMHPVKKEPLDISASPPEYWPRLIETGRS